MKLPTLLIAATTATLVASCPGQEGVMKDLHAKLASRQDNPNDSNEMIGDLLTVGATSTVGRAVQNILQGTVSPQSDDTMGLITSVLCLLPGSDPCCIWKQIAKDMEAAFRGSAGRCNGLARGAIRFGFHDAGGWSKSSDYGGADGSILLAPEEMARQENLGLQEIAAQTKAWYNKYSRYGVSMADIIQMGANVATVVCPLGPRVRSFIGRKDSSVPSARLLPNPFASADSLIELFEDKTIRANGLAALLGAHTTSQQRFFNTSRANDPQDSTPGVWDVLYYAQTLGTVDTPVRVFKLPSDVAMSTHPKMKDDWLAFTGPDGQNQWNLDYAREYVRLSLLGVNNINNLKECTKVLPPAVKVYNNPDQKPINKWLTDASLSKSAVTQVGGAMRDGNLLSAIQSILSLLGL